MSAICPFSNSSVLRALVDAALPAWHPTRALYVGADLRIQDDDHEPLSSGSVHLIIFKGSNYLTVWEHLNRDILPRVGRVPLEAWGPHASHHDSGWLSSAEGAITQHYFDLCKEANSILKERGEPTKAPMHLNQHHALWNTQLLDIEYESREVGEYRPKRFLTSIKEYRPENQYRERG